MCFESITILEDIAIHRDSTIKWIVKVRSFVSSTTKHMEKRSKVWNITLWILQVLLATTFVWSAYMKLVVPSDQLAATWPWTGANEALTKFTGIVDLTIGL